MLSEQFLTFKKPAVRYTFADSCKVNVFTVEATYAERQTNSDVSMRTYHVVAPRDVLRCLLRYADSDDSDDSDDSVDSVDLR